MNAVRLESAVRTALGDLAKTALNTGLYGAPNWTLKVVECMDMLGRGMNYKVSASGLFGEQEWLYDMVWYMTEGQDLNERLTSIPLVMECEWSTASGKIEEDFEKLLLANADLRVMVCRTPPKYRADMTAYFRSAIDAYRQGRTGDHFLVVTRVEATGQFEFETFVKA